MGKRSKARPVEGAGAVSEPTPKTPNTNPEANPDTSPDATAGATDKDAKIAELEAMLKRQEERLAAKEQERAAEAARAEEAAQRVAEMAQAQAQAPQTSRPRESMVLTSDVLSDRPLFAPQVQESARRKVRPQDVRLGKGSQLGECSHSLVAENLLDAGESKVHVTLPDNLRTQYGKDAYEAVFRDGRAEVPGPVAEILLAQGRGRYSRIN